MQPLASRPALIGRAAEAAAVQELLARAAGGESAALLVRGAAGIGKTELLAEARERAAPGLRVLQTTGVEAESDLPFAALYGLLRPVLDLLDDVPERQRAALAGALGLAAGAAADRFLVSAGALSLLAAAAEPRPLLCLIDDAQWLDRPSADALAFAARRMQAEPIAMLFAARDGEADELPVDGLPELVLEPLDEASAAELLAGRGGALGAAAAERLLAEAGGNPLALVELAASLSEAQRSDAEGLPDVLPLTPRLERLFRGRLDALPPETQAALLVAAAADGGDLAVLHRATDRLGLPADCLDAAAQARLVRLDDTELAFHHPLVRAAVYDAAAAGDRRRAHAALADVLTDEHLDRRVWHRARAAVGSDEKTAAALEALGGRARARAAHASAASALVRASELSAAPERRAARLAAAAEAAWDAGQIERARRLVAEALDSGADRERARLLFLRGVIETRHGDLRESLPLLLEAAAASTDPSLTLEILREAAGVAADLGSRARVGDLARRVAALEAQSPRDRFSRAIVTGLGLVFDGRYEPSREAFSTALALAERLPDDVGVQTWAAQAASAGFGLGSGLAHTARAVELARGQGRVSLLPAALTRHALELVWSSRPTAAYEAADEAHRLAVDLGQSRGWPLAVLAHVEAVQGRFDEARSHGREALAFAQASGRTFLATFARAAAGLLELSAGRPADAADVLLELTAGDREDVHPIVAVRAVPDTVEALARAGRPRRLADAPLDWLRRWVAELPTEPRRALLARCEALVEARPSEEAFAEAAALAPTLLPFEHARTELLYGEWLRRRRRRSEARTHLRKAGELFRSLGAAPWEERAEAELRATGVTAGRRDPSSLAELTPQERQIAQLVAAGLTNRDVAAQLFLSPRTVEYHLRKVFAKLGIASRVELIRRADSLSPGA